MKPNSTPWLNRPNLGSQIAGNACILIATIFWGINVTVTKALIPDWMTANSIVVVRLIGGCLLFWIASLFMKTTPVRTRSDWGKFALAGTVGLFLFIYLFVTSLKYANPIDVSIIMTMPPMFVLLIGIIFLKQRPSWMEYLGVAVSMAGAIIVIIAGAQSSQAGSDNLLGLLLAVASTICYAFYLVVLEKPTQQYSPVSMLRWVFLFAAIPALLLVPGGDKLPILSTSVPTPWVEIIFILLGPTFAAYFLVQPAIRRIGSEMVSLYQYLLPVFAAISAVAMGIDKIRWEQVLAMAIIVAGMVMTNIGRGRRKVR